MFSFLLINDWNYTAICWCFVQCLREGRLRPSECPQEDSECAIAIELDLGLTCQVLTWHTYRDLEDNANVGEPKINE